MSIKSWVSRVLGKPGVGVDLHLAPVGFVGMDGAFRIVAKDEGGWYEATASNHLNDPLYISPVQPVVMFDPALRSEQVLQ